MTLIAGLEHDFRRLGDSLTNAVAIWQNLCPPARRIHDFRLPAVRIKRKISISEQRIAVTEPLIEANADAAVAGPGYHAGQRPVAG